MFTSRAEGGAGASRLPRGHRTALPKLLNGKSRERFAHAVTAPLTTDPSFCCRRECADVKFCRKPWTGNRLSAQLPSSLLLGAQQDQPQRHCLCRNWLFVFPVKSRQVDEQRLHPPTISSSSHKTARDRGVGEEKGTWSLRGYFMLAKECSTCWLFIQKRITVRLG